jgi:flagellar hook assembly protein FlgD
LTNLNEKMQDLHNQVNTSDLIHKLHAIGKKNTSSSLHLVALQDLTPPVIVYQRS